MYNIIIIIISQMKGNAQFPETSKQKINWSQYVCITVEILGKTVKMIQSDFILIN